MTLTPEQKPQLASDCEGRVIHRPRADRQLDFRLPRQALAAKSELAFVMPPTKPWIEQAVAYPGLDDVFIDDITVPATDGYPLAATLFLPVGPIAMPSWSIQRPPSPRKLYRGFAGYLIQRGCALLTYDYRGTGDSRPQARTG
jgi:hypothetical protein